MAMQNGKVLLVVGRSLVQDCLLCDDCYFFSRDTATQTPPHVIKNIRDSITDMNI